MSTEYFMIPERTPPAPPPPKRNATTPVPRPANTTVLVKSQLPPNVGALRQEPWAVPILALACGCMLTIGGFEVFVVYGASQKAPSHRHLLLGQTLLFGLFTCAATAALFATTPTVFSCGAVRFGTGVAYVIVFASLLVKCVFLLSLNGGVYLPAAYQGLLLFFAVMIQVAIGAQWLGGAPPRVAAGGARCASELAELLLSLCYAACLGAGGRRLAALGREGRWDADRDEGLSTLSAGAGGSGYSPSFFHFKPVKYGMVSPAAAPAPPAPRKEPPAQPAGQLSIRRALTVSVALCTVDLTTVLFTDPYGAMFAHSPHLHSRALYSPPHYPMHPPFPYPYNYPPYPYLLPPDECMLTIYTLTCAGVMMRGEEGNVYTSVEPTFSSNPNVYFQRSEPLHAGMMY
ncbi:Uncharacterized protein OBRU01_05807 [Operophtera brumata]|uniref:G-protein coupled receptors family 3 profile domain-containing protein n=1 Tax=Operophtera brumata TaxID=104452 RepID=A0A0L7LB56_OPEBR|nr:Uncharacterized protein OBRU01_05807 [Operophtera brumata]